jgi:ribosomal protein S18 acetylase RimI-like enzyme
MADIQKMIRRPRHGDLQGIANVVRRCGPYLTDHMSYILWIYIYCHHDTCAVAESDGRIVGWISVQRMVGSSRYFLHQLAVDPGSRCLGIGDALLSHLLNVMVSQSPDFALEFTVERNNSAGRKAIGDIAARHNMEMTSQRKSVELLEDCVEELYVMVPKR